MAQKREDPLTLKNDRLILSEGKHDCAFFRHLITQRSLPASDVFCVPDIVGSRGRDSFKNVLKGLRVVHGFDRLKDIIIVSDSDADPDQSFLSIVKQIRNVENLNPSQDRSYPVPEYPHQKAVGYPSITILLLPWKDQPGSLEDLCYQALVKKSSTHKSCVESFAECCGINAWEPQKISKMKLRAFIAVYYKKKPDMPLGLVWNRCPSLIPVEDVVFDKISDFLKNLQ